MNKLILTIFLLLAFCRSQAPPEMYMNFEEMCDYYGFPFEEHEVVTQDGYHITLYRIPGDRDHSSDDETGYPILLVPSMGHAAVMFAINGPEESPAFYLANHGFDVWVSNERQSVPSRGHEVFDWRQDAEYWNSTLYEFNYDWEAAIRYMIDITPYSQVAAGFNSHRAAGSLMGLSFNPEFYHENVSVVALFSPQYRYDLSETPSFTYYQYDSAFTEYLSNTGTFYWAPRNRKAGMEIDMLAYAICGRFPIM